MLEAGKLCIRKRATEGAGRQATLAARNQGTDFILWTVEKLVGGGPALVLELWRLTYAPRRWEVDETRKRRKWKR